MKSYKEYMDRIRVDEAQHGRFLEAMRKAEAEAQAGSKAAPDEAAGNAVPVLPSDKKKRFRFPVLKIAGVAAAAVLAFVLILGPAGGKVAQPAKEADSTQAVTAVPTAQKDESKMPEANTAPAGLTQAGEQIDGSEKITDEKMNSPEQAGMNEPSASQAAASTKRSSDGAPQPAECEVEAGTVLTLNDGQRETVLTLNEEEAALFEKWILEGVFTFTDSADVPAVDELKPVPTSATQAAANPEGSAAYTVTYKTAVFSVTLTVDGTEGHYVLYPAGLDGESLAAFRKILEDHGLTLAE
jgi:hypothetical protein